MASLLMALVFLAFVSLGLPDSLLGAGWPVMHVALQVPSGWAGTISMLIAGSTIVSSLASDRLTRRLGVGLVTAGSVLLTALALWGFSLAPNFWALCVIAVPYGLGAGSVDAALNNFAAVHYSSRAMNWLHCCWGIGAAISPFIMGNALAHQMSWRGGYFTVAVVQLVLALVLMASLPLWPKRQKQAQATRERGASLAQVVALPGVRMVMLAFGMYCGLESLTGLWAASYLHAARGVAPVQAAMFASLFYLGITAGRLLAGFFADALGDHRLVLGGGMVVGGGLLAMLLPLPNVFALAGLVVVGIGCAPIYPAIIHATPINFAPEYSQAIIGVQMAAAYTGSTFVPPIFGGIGHLGWLPWLMCGLWAMLLVSYWRMHRQVVACGRG